MTKKIVLSVILAIAAAAVIFAVWFFIPKTFLKGVDPSDIKSVSVFDGNTGKSFVIDDADEIKSIVENIQNTELRRGKISLAYAGYGFRLGFGDSSGKSAEFIINSNDTVRADPFFYRCSGGLCFDYLKELEGKYAG